MPDPIRVNAAPGRLVPVPGRPGHFVGYRRATKHDDRADLEVPGGHRYVAVEAEVPADAYHRRALRRGDLVEVKAAPKAAPVAKKSSPEGEGKG